MLKTNPQERLTIDDVIRNKWIAVSIILFWKFCDTSTIQIYREIELQSFFGLRTIIGYSDTEFFYNLAASSFNYWRNRYIKKVSRSRSLLQFRFRIVFIVCSFPNLGSNFFCEELPMYQGWGNYIQLKLF